MIINKLKKAPVLLSILIMFFTIAAGNLLSVFFTFLHDIIFVHDNIQKIIEYFILIIFVLFFIKKNKIPHSFFESIDAINYLYYLPSLLCIYIFTGGLNDFSNLPDSALFSFETITYGIKTFSQTFFEEILFRGTIFGLLLDKYYKSKNGILKSVIISSLLFGFIHIINIWTLPNQVAVFNQIYATFCLGFLFAATYLKTRSILMLGILHFMINFFSGIGALGDTGHAVVSTSQDQTIIEIIVSIIITLVIFGIPFLLGLFILKTSGKKDVEMLKK